MMKYRIFKIKQDKDGKTRKHIKDTTGKSVAATIVRNKLSGDLSTGDYIIYRILKNGTLGKVGTPFTHYRNR